MVSRLYELVDKNKNRKLTDPESREMFDLIGNNVYEGNCLECYPNKTGNGLYDTNLCKKHLLESLIIR
jgi:hypothetical protein